MRIRTWLANLLCVSVMLFGCSVPRGAGLQTEVLAAQSSAKSDKQLPDFAVFPVTKTGLPVIADWPAAAGGGQSWIGRKQQTASLIIAPGDSVSITVWDAEENSLLAGPGQKVTQLQPMQVSSGGSVFLPFVGDMRIAGMSPDGARKRIEARYAETIPSAQVQLSVVAGRANTASLVSGVANPGTFPLVDRDVTLLGLLSQGGGVQSDLINPQVRLFRGSAVYGISLSRLYDDPSLDTTLQGGDRVIVEAEKRYFLSLGAAGTEALHLFPKDRVTALDALAIVGGVQDERANPKGILILREYAAKAVKSDGSGPPQKRVVFTVDLTTADGLFSAGQFAVMPGDLVYATESPVSSAKSVFGLLGTVIGVASKL